MNSREVECSTLFSGLSVACVKNAVFENNWSENLGLHVSILCRQVPWVPRMAAALCCALKFYMVAQIDADVKGCLWQYDALYVGRRFPWDKPPCIGYQKVSLHVPNEVLDGILHQSRHWQVLVSVQIENNK